MPTGDDLRPTLLLVGEGEPMEAALRVALDRHRMTVESTDAATVVEAAIAAAPDLVVLIGDAVVDGGAPVLRHLAENPSTSVVPVAVLSNDAGLGERLRAFRSGAVALIERSASADAVARALAQVARELPERSGQSSGPLGEATLDELVELVSRELRSGILSVQADSVDRGEPVRVVLGAGGPIGDVLSDFVTRLKPLIAKAEPLRYELLEEPGGRLRLFGADDKGTASLDLLAGMRVLVMDHDPGRADGLAQALREHGSLVGVTDVGPAGLDRARALGPEVIILDSAAIEGEGYDTVRSLRIDTHLRWAALLVARWDELWPAGLPAPDLELLAGRLAPLTEHDRALHTRAETEQSFDTRLELTGPARLMRSLARASGTRHVVVRGSRATIELDIADGLIAGAQGVGRLDVPHAIEGLAAISTLLNLAAARVRVERRDHPAVANVMLPVEEALALASQEAPALKPSVMPASMESDAPPSRPRPAAYAKLPTRATKGDASPFPSAAALLSPSEPEPSTTDSESGLSSDSGGVATRLESEGVPSTSDLHWDDGPRGGLSPTPLPSPPPLAGNGYRPPPPPGKRRTAAPPVAPLPPKPVKAAAPAPATPLPPRKRSGTILGTGARPGFMSEPAPPREDETTKHSVDFGEPTYKAALPPEATSPATAASLELDDVVLELDDETLRPSEVDVGELSAAPARPPVSAAPPATPSPTEDMTEAHVLEPRPLPTPAVASSGRTRRRILLVALGILAGASVGGTAAYLIPPTSPALATTPASETVPPAPPSAAAAPLPESPEVPVEVPAVEAPIEAPAPVAAPTPTPPPAPAAAVEAPEAPGFTPDFALPSNKARASDVLVEDAQRLIEAEQLDVADRALVRAFELDPRNPQGFATLALLRRAQGRMADAIVAAEDAVRVRRRRGEYYLLLGDLLRDDGRPAEARAVYRDGMRAEPSRALREALASVPD